MIDQEESGTGCGGGEDGVEDLGWGLQGEGDLCDVDVEAALVGNISDGIIAGVVSMVGDEDIILGVPWKGSQDGVNTIGGVVDPSDRVGWGVQMLGEEMAYRVEFGFEEAFGSEEFDRSGFKLVLVTPLCLENDAGRCAERAMVEEGKAWIELPMVREGGSRHGEADEGWRGLATGCWVGGKSDPAASCDWLEEGEAEG